MNFKPKFLRRFAATSSGQQDALIFDPQGALNGSEQDPAMQERTGRRAVLDGKRVFRVVALLCIAWGVGQLMQVVGPSNATQQLALAQEAVIGTTSEAEVTLASLGVDTALGIVAAPGAEAVVTLADRPALDPVAPAPGEPAALASADAAVGDLASDQIAGLATPEAKVQLAAATPGLANPEPPEMRVEKPSATAAAAPAATDCTATLHLSVAPGALLGVTLVAPCAPNARVVLRHEGLAITVMTTATGALFTALPALATLAVVEAKLPGGAVVSATAEVPEAANFRRFGVQFQGDDVFQLNAYENGAAFGELGHIFGMNRNVARADGSFLQMLGDRDAAMPLMAQIYTYPVGNAAVMIAIEAPVTAKTCGHEMIGETLLSSAGRVVLTDLTLAMPDCSAIGDFLVLNNLVPDVTLASN